MNKVKMKTRKIAFKRYKVTKTGKILHGHQNSRHLRRKKSASALRRHANPNQAFGTYETKITNFLPYA